MTLRVDGIYGFAALEDALEEATGNGVRLRFVCNMTGKEYEWAQSLLTKSAIMKHVNWVAEKLGGSINLREHRKVELELNCPHTIEVTPISDCSSMISIKSYTVDQAVRLDWYPP